MELGGSSLASKYNNSPLQLLSGIFPDFQWLPWNFSNTPKDWKDFKNQRHFMENVAKRMKILEPSGWNSISAQVFHYNLLFFPT